MYPTTNRELLNSEYAGKDVFFLLARVSQDNDGVWFVDVSPDLPPMANNDELKQEVFEKTGVTIPSRKDVNNNTHGLDGNIKMLGAGAFLWVEDSNSERKLVLLKRGENAPAAANAWEQPSGLVSDLPVATILRELNEETAVISVDIENQRLLVHGFIFPDEVAKFKDEEVESIMLAKADGYDYIMNRIRVDYPQYQSYELVFSEQVVSTSLERGISSLEKVIYKMPDGNILSLNGHVLDELDHNSFNFHIALEADMSQFPILINVDPEIYDQKASLLTPKEVLGVDKTTGPLGAYRDSWSLGLELDLNQSSTVVQKLDKGGEFKL